MTDNHDKLTRDFRKQLVVKIKDLIQRECSAWAEAVPIERLATVASIELACASVDSMQGLLLAVEQDKQGIKDFAEHAYEYALEVYDHYDEDAASILAINPLEMEESA
jgi:hypothetical protein